MKFGNSYLLCPRGQDIKHKPTNSALKINHMFQPGATSLITLKMSSLIFIPKNITTITEQRGLFAKWPSVDFFSQYANKQQKWFVK